MLRLSLIVGILFSINSYTMYDARSNQKDIGKLFHNIDNNDICVVLDQLDTNPSLLCVKDDVTGWTPLHRAIIKNQQEIALVFIHKLQENWRSSSQENSRDYPLNFQDFEGNTPLHLAFAKGYDLITNALFEAQADITLANNDNIVIAEKLAEQYEYEASVKLEKEDNILNNNGKNYPIFNKFGFASNLRQCQSPDQQLYYGMRNRDCMQIQDALEKGANIHSPIDAHSSTPLHHSVAAGYEEITQLLLDYGADPNIKNALGSTPFKYAMKTRYNNRDDYETLVTLLLNKGGDYTLQDANGKSILESTEDDVNSLIASGQYFYSRVGRRLELLKKYISLFELAKVSPSRTVLEQAIRYNFARIIELLIAQGVQITKADLEQADKYNARDVIEALNQGHMRELE